MRNFLLTSLAVCVVLGSASVTFSESVQQKKITRTKKIRANYPQQGAPGARARSVSVAEPSPAPEANPDEAVGFPAGSPASFSPDASMNADSRPDNSRGFSDASIATGSASTSTVSATSSGAKERLRQYKLKHRM